MNFYPKYDPATYHSRELYRVVCETRTLSPVWAHKNAQKWGVDYESFLKLCGETCACCGSPLNYGLGKNNVDKLGDNPLFSIAGAQAREQRLTRTQQGFPLSYFYGYKVLGIFRRYFQGLLFQ